MALSVREQLVRLLASNINGDVGMAWYPSGEPTDKAYTYADVVIAAFPVLSEVGGVETKLPLDPKPWVDGRGERWRWDFGRERFAPRDGYSQDEGDYR